MYVCTYIYVYMCMFKFIHSYTKYSMYVYASHRCVIGPSLWISPDPGS